MSDYDYEEIINLLDKIKCITYHHFDGSLDEHYLGIVHSDDQVYDLNQTQYYLIASRFEGLVWFKKVRPPVCWLYVSFEKVLEEAPEHIQQELLFHLDLFR